jgi:hypothetical protein
MAQAIQGDKHIPFYQLEEFPLQHIHYGTSGTELKEARVFKKKTRIDQLSNRACEKYQSKLSYHLVQEIHV